MHKMVTVVVGTGLGAAKVVIGGGKTLCNTLTVQAVQAGNLHKCAVWKLAQMVQMKRLLGKWKCVQWPWHKLRWCRYGLDISNNWLNCMQRYYEWHRQCGSWWCW